MQATSSFIVFSILFFVPQSELAPLTTITRSNDVLLPFNESTEDDARIKETFSQLVASIFEPMVKKFILLYFSNLFSLSIGIELLTMSNGDHFGIIVPQTEPELDLEMHKQAMAIVDLWLELPTMQQVELAAGKATAEVGELASRSLFSDELVVDANVTKNILHLVLQKIIFNLKNNDDAEIYEKFVSVKKELDVNYAKSPVGHRIFFPKENMTDKTEREIYRQWFALPRIRKFMVNKLFVQHCLKRVPRPENQEYERIVLAKAIIGLSKVKSKADQVVKLYNDVIAEIADQFDWTLYRFGSHSTSFGGFNPELFAKKTTPILFEKLQTKFDSDPELTLQLLKMKSSVVTDAIFETWNPASDGLFFNIQNNYYSLEV